MCDPLWVEQLMKEYSEYIKEFPTDRLFYRKMHQLSIIEQMKTSEIGSSVEQCPRNNDISIKEVLRGTSFILYRGIYMW